MSWPTQKQCDAFYGNPRNKLDSTKPSAAWESANLVRIDTPFKMTYDGKPMIKGPRMHKLVKTSLERVFEAIWLAAGRSQAKIDQWGVSIYGGGYNYRLMRSGLSLSMHSYGCAIDLDPARNAQHDTTPDFGSLPAVVDAFKQEGWIWGGDWSPGSRDGMHFQAASL